MDDIQFSDGPYYLSSYYEPQEENIIVRGLTTNDFDITLSPESNGKPQPGLVTLTVKGTGNYEGQSASKTYLLLDDTQEVNPDDATDPTKLLNINFTPQDENGNYIGTEINLNIPIIEGYFEGYIDEYGTLSEGSGENSAFTNDDLANALTAWSQDESYGENDIVAPFYEYTVSGFNNFIETESPKIEVTLTEKSYICLDISTLETAKVISQFSEMVELNPEVSILSKAQEFLLEAAEEDESKSQYIYAPVAALDISPKDSKITEEEVMAYINSDKVPEYKGASILSEFEALDLTTPFTLGIDDFNVNDDGYYIIEVAATPVSTGSNNGGHTGGSGGGSSAAQKPKPEEPKPTIPVVGTPTSMYRLYNRLTGEHLYTMDKDERDHLLTSDTWQDEGEGWIAPCESAYPVYRLLNPNTSDHHYTMDKNEFDTLPSLGWVAEGIAFFSADKDNPENVILYRLYNPNAKGAGMHHYTTNEKERDTLVSMGWKYEGLAWAALPKKK